MIWLPYGNDNIVTYSIMNVNSENALLRLNPAGGGALDEFAWQNGLLVPAGCVCFQPTEGCMLVL